MKLSNFIAKLKALGIKDNSIDVTVSGNEITDVLLVDDSISIETAKKELKTLIDSNKESAKIHNTLNSIYKPIPNSIACPICKPELLDMEPGVVYLTMPPKTKVGCPNCHYSGTRIC